MYLTKCENIGAGWAIVVSRCETCLFCFLNGRGKGCEIRIKSLLGTGTSVRECDLSVFDLSVLEQYRIKKDLAGTGDLVRGIHSDRVIRGRVIEV